MFIQGATFIPDSRVKEGVTICRITVHRNGGETTGLFSLKND